MAQVTTTGSQIRDFLCDLVFLAARDTYMERQNCIRRPADNVKRVAQIGLMETCHIMCNSDKGTSELLLHRLCRCGLLSAKASQSLQVLNKQKLVYCSTECGEEDAANKSAT